ncbi:MAG: hypothetical protein QW128_08345 [Thermoprotei archaeon]
MKREFLDYLEDIIRVMENVMDFVEGMDYEDFIKDKRTIYAVIKQFQS